MFNLNFFTSDLPMLNRALLNLSKKIEKREKYLDEDLKKNYDKYYKSGMDGLISSVRYEKDRTALEVQVGYRHTISEIIYAITILNKEVMINQDCFKMIMDNHNEEKSDTISTGPYR